MEKLHLRKIFAKIKVIVVLLVIGLAGVNFCEAKLVPCGEEGNPCKLCHLWQLGDKIIDFLIFDISIPLGSLLFLIAGVILLTSGGNENRVTLAKDIFINTTTGLIIVFVAWLIVDTLFNTLAAGEFSAAWNKFPDCP